MKKIEISHELIARYIEGNATVEETELILRAAKMSSEFREHLDFMSSLADYNTDIEDGEAENNVAKTCALFVPMWRLAAQNKNYEQGNKALSDCVVRCEYEIMKSYNLDVNYESLLKDNKWLQADGTPLYNVGRLLEEKNLSVVRRYDSNIDVVSLEIYYGCHIIVVVNAEKLYGITSSQDNPNHAVIVKEATDDHIIIYDPQNQKEETYTPSHFIEAWKDSHYYMVSVTERGKRIYDPQPVNVSGFQLSDDLEELKEAIAENAHDVWARQRMNDGWKYGLKRDDDKKLHPDLVPYSDLPETEKEYDRNMAKQTLKLVRALGYKIIKE